MKFSSISKAIASVQILFFFQVLPAQTLPKTYIIDKGVNPGLILDELLPPPPEIEGNSYYSEAWQKGSLIFKSGYTINNYPLRYDIGNFALEIKADESVKFCPIDVLEGFEWFDLTKNKSVEFISCDNFNIEGYDRLSGMFEILSEGDLTLLSLSATIIKEPNYLPTVAIGNQNKQIIKKEKFFLGNGVEAIAIDPNLKKSLNLFGDHAEEIKEYAKKEGLKSRKREDLIRMVDYYNSLAIELN